MKKISFFTKLIATLTLCMIISILTFTSCSQSIEYVYLNPLQGPTEMMTDESRDILFDDHLKEIIVGDASDVIGGMISFVGDSIGSFIVNKALDAIWGAIFTKKDPYSEKLDKILQKLDALKNQLDELRQKGLITAYEQAVTHKQEVYQQIAAHNVTTWNTIKEKENEIKADPTVLNDIVMEWGNATVNGSPAPEQVICYIEMLASRNVVDCKSYFQIYDALAYNTFAWEEDGYPTREGVRAYDAATMAQAAVLAGIYYTQKNQISNAKLIKTYIDKLVKLLSDNEVIKQRNSCISQIKGAHMRFDKYMCNVDYESLLNDQKGSSLDKSQQKIYAQNTDFGSKLYLSQEEYNVFQNFYGTYDLVSIFRDKGHFKFDRCEDYQNKAVCFIAKSGASNEHQSHQNWYLSFDCIQMRNKEKTVHKNRVGIVWLNGITSNADIKGWDTYYHDQIWIYPHLE